ncbi:MAG TPA: VCBS repeat-containing protein [Polyangia bacterium]|jgi:MYXO-CTERM domain-containing protein|nr:VCBS repeat-containing protein [Polyangia bacterium]
MRKAWPLVLVCGISVSAPAAAQTFTNVTTESGIGAVRAMRAANWWMSGIQLCDLDGDGDLDYFMGAHGGGGIAALNDGRGHFTALPTAPWANSEFHLMYDLNEDGKLDLSITEDDGGGRWFMNQSTTAGMPAFAKSPLSDQQSRTQNMIDLNRDGKVDWFVADDAPRGPPYKIRLYEGDGKGGFGAALLQTSLDGMPLTLDVDNDGDIDVIGLLGNPPSSPVIPNGTRLFLNDGKMSFRDATAAAGLDKPGLFILGVGDVDQDGDTDLIAFDNDTFPLVIYTNDGTGVFSRKAGAITEPASGKAIYGNIGLATVTDIDNDGVADILAEGLSFFQVLRGTGGGSFQYANKMWGGIVDTGNLPDSGFAFGDIDGDGDLDIIGYRVATSSDRAPNVYRNDLPRQNWVKVRPVGLPGNHGAAGAKISVYEAGTTKLLWYDEVIIRAKQVQQNYYSFADTERHFGLGSRASVDVVVHFYPSNKEVRQSAVAANSTVRIGEDGMGMIVPPIVVSPPSDGGTPGGADSGAAGGQASGSGGAGGMASMGTGGAGTGGTSGTGGGTGGGVGHEQPTGTAGGGCSCRMDQTSPGEVAWLFAVAALIVVRRGRRRR